MAAGLFHRHHTRAYWLTCLPRCSCLSPAKQTCVSSLDCVMLIHYLLIYLFICFHQQRAVIFQLTHSLQMGTERTQSITTLDGKYREVGQKMRMAVRGHFCLAFTQTATMNWLVHLTLFHTWVLYQYSYLTDLLSMLNSESQLKQVSYSKDAIKHCVTPTTLTNTQHAPWLLIFL